MHEKTKEEETQAFILFENVFLKAAAHQIKFQMNCLGEPKEFLRIFFLLQTNPNINLTKYLIINNYLFFRKKKFHFFFLSFYCL